MPPNPMLRRGYGTPPQTPSPSALRRCVPPAPRSGPQSSPAMFVSRWRHWLGRISPQKCRLAPNVKHNGQESGGELCKISNWSFLQSISVNNICKLLQTPHRGFAVSPWTPGLLYLRPLRPLTDDPSFSYEKLVREIWSKKLGRVSSFLVRVFSRTRNLDGLEHCSILYETLGVTWLKCCVAIG